jgi:hypothetical protein
MSKKIGLKDGVASIFDVKPGPPNETAAEYGLLIY